MAAAQDREAPAPACLVQSLSPRPVEPASSLEEDALPAQAVAPIQIPDGENAVWPSEAAEVSALADAQEKGEDLRATPLSEEALEETDKKGLPELAQVLEKLPAELRETLDDLFRARWTRVTRIRRKDLA